MACRYIEQSKHKTTAGKSKTSSPAENSIQQTPNEGGWKFHRPHGTGSVPEVIQKQPMTTKDDLACTPLTSKLSLKLSRSQSTSNIGAKMVVSEPPSPNPALSEGSTSSASLCQSGSLTPRPLFANSTVSLQSVGLNEDYVRDQEGNLSPSPNTSKPQSNQSGELRQRKPEENKSQKPPPPPLSEVDRFSMVSNRIV